jgi:hypothetical protein
MSEREQPIKDWSAVSYLRDFINTALILDVYEQEIIDFLCDSPRNVPAKVPRKKIIKSERTKLAKQGLKKCKVCQEILDISEFYKDYGVCKICTQEIRRQKRLCNDKNS